MEPAIIVHSGAGFFVDSRNQEKIDITTKAVREGYKILQNTNDPVLAVEGAVRVMEDDISCNAGFGSVLTKNGEVEMDAMIIRGSDLATGGVGAVKHIKNPISLSKLVMEKTNHALLVGMGAEDFAISQGIPLVTTEELTSPRSKLLLDCCLKENLGPSTETGIDVNKDTQEKGLGTVGAVAINSNGELAAATSTGGLNAKLPGRVGDTPIPGGGTYCDNSYCGVSATGLGEAIMKACLASRIAFTLESGKTCNEVILESLEYMSSKAGGDGGAIAITKTGEIGHNHNSKKMTWAYIKGKHIHYGIEKGKEFIEEL